VASYKPTVGADMITLRMIYISMLTENAVIVPTTPMMAKCRIMHGFLPILKPTMSVSRFYPCNLKCLTQYIL